MIIAFGSVPKDGGTFTFYRNIRPELIKHGIDIRCVSVGKDEAQLIEVDYIDEGCVQLAENTGNLKKQAMAFADWCEQERVDIVMGINSEAILSALPHLPENTRVMARCANAFDHGYKIALSCKERLAAIVATTPRLEHDLAHHYGADPSLLHLIPNGIDPVPFGQAAKRLRGQEPVLQLGFLGRLEDNQKGVFHLPKIVNELNRQEVRFKLHIAGKGKHRSIIENEMADEILSGQVEFLGAITHEDVPEFLAATDVYLFTSHFEGCPNTLLEALMAGCVPVSWLIEGITDFIIDDGKTGFIHTTGDYLAFCQSINELDTNRDHLSLMSRAASDSARQRFSHQRTAKGYAELFQIVMNDDPPAWQPVPWSEFKGDPNFEHSWREWVPVGIKQGIKKLIAPSDAPTKGND